MAHVVKEFDGVRDGETQPVHFNVGDEVEGDLARVALEEGWAEGSTEQSAPRRRGRRNA